MALKELMAQKMSSLVENAEERRAKKVKKYTSRRLNEENRMTDPFFSLMKKKSKLILVDKSGKDLKRYEMGVEAMLGQVPLKDLKQYLTNMNDEEIDLLPDESSSEEDDKTTPAFWNKGQGFTDLPAHV